MNIWIVGTVPEEGQWHLAGVYTTKEDALARCKTIRDFIGPAELDKDLPDEIIEWPGAYYPLYEEAIINWPIV